MKLDGTFTFAGPRALVWELLQDPEVLARALPGTERLESTGPDRFRGVMKANVGPVSAATFEVSVALNDKRPPEHFTMQIEGRGRVGHIRGNATVDLDEQDGGSGTSMRYGSDVQVGGTIAAVGQRLIDSVARSMMKQALEALDREVRSRLEGGTRP